MSKDIATGTALTLLIFSVSIYLPIIGFFCAIFLPLPVLFYRTKLGRQNGAIIPLMSLIFIAGIVGKVSADVMIFFELLLLGFILGEMYARRLSVEKTVGYTCAIVLGVAAGCLFWYSIISNINFTDMVAGYVAKNLELTLQLYQNMGVSDDSIQMISDAMPQIQYVLIRIIPAFAMVSALFICWTSVLMSRPLFKNRQLPLPDFGSLILWKAPEILVWGVIGCGIMMLFPIKALKIIGLNGILVMMTIYFFQGIAIVSYFFEKKNFPRPLRVFFYCLIALQQMFLLIVISCGFFDVWLNFRKLNSEELN